MRGVTMGNIFLDRVTGMSSSDVRMSAADVESVVGVRAGLGDGVADVCCLLAS